MFSIIKGIYTGGAKKKMYIQGVPKKNLYTGGAKKNVYTFQEITSLEMCIHSFLAPPL